VFEDLATELWPKRQGVVVFQLMSVYMAMVEPGAIDRENRTRLEERLNKSTENRSTETVPQRIFAKASTPDLLDIGPRKKIARAMSVSIEAMPH
jgi:hypothetical protein